MTPAPSPHTENDRIEALRRYQILDTEAEELFDSITKLAATICDVPIALISLIDEDRQWFKSKVGLDVSETHRDYAFCSHSILRPDELMVVPDATKDERFYDNPLVTDKPDIRFYAGAPIVTKDRHALGTLCVIDTKTRELSEKQLDALESLSRQVCANLDLRLAHKKLELLNESKNCFFSILAHDLRSPVSSIQSIADLLTDSGEDLTEEELKEWHGHLKVNAEVTGRTLDNLLRIVQFEEGRFKTAFSSIKVSNVICTVEELLRGHCLDKDIKLKIECLPDIEVWADPRLLQSIIQNLVTNAVKFSHPGSEVHVSVRQDYDQVSVVVEDFGVGISPDKIPRLFLLESAHSTIGTAGERGTGLGLNLCKQFATRQHGDLIIESVLDKGTQATLVLRSKEPAAAG